MMQALPKKSNLEGLIYAIFLMCHYVPPSQTSSLASQVTGYLRWGASLQAVAPTHRLATVVTGLNVRGETREQDEPLGAKFVDTWLSADR